MPIEITIPGSKSITNRVLLLSYLCGKKTKIKNAAICDDTKYMKQGLNALASKSKKNKIYTGNAGTTTRFLTALATLSGKSIKIYGDKRMQKRPIAPLAKALNTLGAKVETTNSCPPVKIGPKKLIGGKVSLPGNISSQYISALLMVTPFAKKEIIISIEQKTCSKPYIKMTLGLLKQFGIKIINKNFKQFKITPIKTPKPPKSFFVESDASSASYFGAYTALHPGKTILLKNLYKNSIQGDIKFLQYLQKMGCKITSLKNGTKIKGPKRLKSLGKIDMNETPDLVMTFAILAMFTKGKTKITNIENLRIKETDRIAALKNEIEKLGIKVAAGKNFIEIYGNPNILKTLSKKKIYINTYNDHRIAMCFGIIQDLIPHLKIKNPSCVSKSYPNFWEDLKKAKKCPY